MDDVHCYHCADHAARLVALEVQEKQRDRDDAIRDAALSLLRWGIPILVTAVGIVIAIQGAR